MRDLALKGLLLLALALFAGFAWLTRHPETAWLDRATEWPLVGEMAREFAARYRPRAVSTRGKAAGLESPAERPSGPQPAEPREPIGARPQVWVEDGTVLREEPREGAAPIVTLRALANLPLFGRSGEWFDVAYRGRRGWARLPGHREPQAPPLGSEPRPPAPVAARRPDEARLAAARALFGSGYRESRLGSYRLHTDVPEDRLGAGAGRAVAGLEPFYFERYGLRPIDEPLEAVVLFDAKASFRAFEAGEGELGGLAGAGFSSGGIVASFVGDRPPGEVASTLVHEIGHLLNRRALGPALPAWLDEGLAGDLAHCVQDEDGTLDAARLGGVVASAGDRREWRGGLAAAIQLRRAVEEGRLPGLASLLALDWHGFVAAPESALHYAQSAFWIRYLLEGPEYGPRFRQFLAAVAGGEAASAEALAAHLGETWAELDSGFRIWVKLRFHEPLEVILEGT